MNKEEIAKEIFEELEKVALRFKLTLNIEMGLPEFIELDNEIYTRNFKKEIEKK